MQIEIGKKYPYTCQCGLKNAASCKELPSIIKTGDENMKTAMIGDNCIDVYVRINGEVVNRRYPTGNCVDTGVNLQKLGIPTAIISTTGSDADGK